ncbi:hypothetical protein Bca4012_070676 [Brassica carinata]
MVTVEKSGVIGSSTALDLPKFTDIDSDDKDPLLCCLYAPEIYYNLRVSELKRRPVPDFMERIQKDVTQSMRGILVDWLVEILTKVSSHSQVSEEYTLVSDTLYLTVYLIDWFLHGNYLERQRLQLLGITCMLIASKYEEINAPRIEEFCFITDNTYTRDQIPRRELECLASYLTELTLIDYHFLKFLPSVIAASAVFLAKWTLDQSNHPWNPTLEHYTTYKASDLKASVHALQDLQLNTKGCPLSAIRMKYMQEKVPLQSHGESGWYWSVDHHKRLVALVARREYGLAPVMRTTGDARKRKLVIGARTSSPIMQDDESRHPNRYWTKVELDATLVQIISALVVLSLNVARDEYPQMPLLIWFIGYTCGCTANLPVLYWRIHTFDQDPPETTSLGAVDEEVNKQAVGDEYSRTRFVAFAWEIAEMKKWGNYHARTYEVAEN